MTFTVIGLPAAQGSKRFVGLSKSGRGILIESSRAVKPWRTAVEQAVMLAAPFGGRRDPILFRGAVSVDVTFTLPRPKSARKGVRPAGRPDLDKLVRSTLDALTAAGVFEDDGRVVSLITQKYYVGHDPICDDNISPVPGAVISVECA